MRKSKALRILLTAAVAVVVSATLTRTAMAEETIRLKIEVYRNGARVAAPTLSINDREGGSLTVNGIGSVSLSPEKLGGDETKINLAVVSPDMAMNSWLVLHENEPGSLSWRSASSNDSIELRIWTLQ